MKQLRLLVVVLSVTLSGLGATGCADPCFQIQQTLCQCRGQTQDERNSCEATVSGQESIEPPTESQLNTCANLLPGCQQAVNSGKSCQVLQTVEGRQACGIAAK